MKIKRWSSINRNCHWKQAHSSATINDLAPLFSVLFVYIKIQVMLQISELLIFAKLMYESFFSYCQTKIWGFICFSSSTFSMFRPSRISVFRQSCNRTKIFDLALACLATVFVKRITSHHNIKWFVYMTGKKVRLNTTPCSFSSHSNSRQ